MVVPVLGIQHIVLNSVGHQAYLWYMYYMLAKHADTYTGSGVVVHTFSQPSGGM